MGSRLELQTKLEELLGNRNVYFDPPENLKMEYPAIRYSISKYDARHADNIKYSNITRYELIVIDKRAGNDVIKKILELPLSSHDRHYTSDNLHHDNIILYF